MIPVVEQPEPGDFDQKVRQKGAKWFANSGLDTTQPLPPKTKIPDHWQDCIPELHEAYEGICAYLCIYMERLPGQSSVDHFRPKSIRPDLAYEWTNYRLAFGFLNSRKRDHEDVLDPFLVEDGMFELELITGSISPGAGLSASKRKKAEATIDRLGLDDVMCRDIRTKWFQYYIDEEITAEFLRERCPFVWREAERQGLL